MKTRRLLKTKRYVGKGISAYWRSRTSDFWCVNGTLEHSIRSRVATILASSDSDAVSLLFQVEQLSLYDDVFDVAVFNHIVTQQNVAELPIINIPAADGHPNLTICVPEGTRVNDQLSFREMSHRMLPLRESIYNIIKTIRNDKSFRTSKNNCRAGKTRFRLSESLSKIMIVKAIIRQIKLIRKAVRFDRDTAQTRYKNLTFFKNNFSYNQLAEYILGPLNPVYVVNVRLQAAQTVALEAQAAEVRRLNILDRNANRPYLSEELLIERIEEAQLQQKLIEAEQQAINCSRITAERAAAQRAAAAAERAAAQRAQLPMYERLFGPIRI